MARCRSTLPSPCRNRSARAAAGAVSRKFTPTAKPGPIGRSGPSPARRSSLGSGRTPDPAIAELSFAGVADSARIASRQPLPRAGDSPGSHSSRKPPPPRLPAWGRVTAKAKAVATAPSTALPPCRMIAAPAAEARPSWLATIPRADQSGWKRWRASWSSLGAGAGVGATGRAAAVDKALATRSLWGSDRVVPTREAPSRWPGRANGIRANRKPESWPMTLNGQRCDALLGANGLSGAPRGDCGVSGDFGVSGDNETA